MEQKFTKNRTEPSLWERFLLWLDGRDVPDEKIRFDLPKNNGDTVMLSLGQRKKLEEAVTGRPEERWETAYYSRDTEVRRKAGESSAAKDNLII